MLHINVQVLKESNWERNNSHSQQKTKASPEAWINQWQGTKLHLGPYAPPPTDNGRGMEECMAVREIFGLQQN